MSITYAGIGLSAWPAPVGAWVEANISPADVYEFDTGHTRHFFEHLPLPDPPRLPPVRVGELVWPSGASRWAVYHACVSGPRLAELRAACLSHPTSPDAYYAPKPLTIVDGGEENGAGRVVSTQMTMLPPRPLSGVSGEFHLLTLVDDRYFWWFKQADIVNPSSWAGLFNQMDLGITIPTPVHAAYKKPQKIRWQTYRKPLPVLADAAAHAVLRRIVRKLDGTVVLQTWEEAKAANEAQFAAGAGRTVRAGGRMATADLCRSAPAALHVVFSKDGSAAPAVVTKTLGTDITGGGSAASGYGCFGFHGRAGAAAAWLSDFSATASTTDAADRAALAAQAVVDYYGWLLADADVVWEGAAPAEPNGFADRIVWRYNGYDGADAWTRYVMPPRATGAHLGGFLSEGSAGVVFGPVTVPCGQSAPAPPRPGCGGTTGGTTCTDDGSTGACTSPFPPPDTSMSGVCQYHNASVRTPCCEGAIPYAFLVTATNGTNAFGSFASTPKSVSVSYAPYHPSGWYFAITSEDKKAKVEGRLQCCGDKGLYFIGGASSTKPHTGYDCGCVAAFCCDDLGNQTIVSALNCNSPVSETLRLTTACGTVDLVITECAPVSPPPPPPTTYNCVNGTCVAVSDGTGNFPTLDACLQFPCNPPPVTYNCVNGFCVDPGDGKGVYATLADCQAAPCSVPPPPVTYNCVSGSCVDPGDGKGAFQTLAACQSFCTSPPPPPVTWNCFPTLPRCREVYDGTGTYATEAECLENCTSPPPPPPGAWYCHPAGCTTTPGGVGPFLTQADCLSFCLGGGGGLGGD